MRTRKACNHPPLSKFIAFKANSGSKVWRCSHCKKEDVWRDGWQYWGCIECRVCQSPGVHAVLCSDKCRDAYKPTDPVMALDLARRS